MKIFTLELIPEIVELLINVVNKNDAQSQRIKFYVEDVFEQLKGSIPSEFESKLREYFKRWVELSQIEDSNAQEQEINNFFEELG